MGIWEVWVDIHGFQDPEEGAVLTVGCCGHKHHS